MNGRKPRPFDVLGFETTHDALDAEALLDDMGVETVTIPTPGSLGALCGIALRIDPADTERALRYLSAAGIGLSGTVRIEDV